MDLLELLYLHIFMEWLNSLCLDLSASESINSKPEPLHYNFCFTITFWKITGQLEYIETYMRVIKYVLYLFPFCAPYCSFGLLFPFYVHHYQKNVRAGYWPASPNEINLSPSFLTRISTLPLNLSTGKSSIQM